MPSYLVYILYICWYVNRMKVHVGLRFSSCAGWRDRTRGEVERGMADEMIKKPLCT